MVNVRELVADSFRDAVVEIFAIIPVRLSYVHDEARGNQDDKSRRYSHTHDDGLQEISLVFAAQIRLAAALLTDQETDNEDIEDQEKDTRNQGNRHKGYPRPHVVFKVGISLRAPTNL